MLAEGPPHRRCSRTQFLNQSILWNVGCSTVHEVATVDLLSGALSVPGLPVFRNATPELQGLQDLEGTVENMLLHSWGALMTATATCFSRLAATPLITL